MTDRRLAKVCQDCKRKNTTCPVCGHVDYGYTCIHKQQLDMTSKTPITDKAAFHVIDADTDECTHAVPVRTSEQLETELAEARAEIDRNDALIKQMRRAMEKVIANYRVNLRDLTDFENEQAATLEAALEAAERGGK